MPNINLTDSRQRDAVVKAENTGVDEEIRYVDDGGNHAYTRKILKATIDHDYDTLIKRYDDDPEKMALALVDTDPEVDMEKCGVFLWGVSKVFVNSDDGIVYRIEQTEVVRDPFGEIKEKRARRRTESNVDADIPLTWTGRQIDKDEAARRYLFSSKLQIVHVNGLTYDFLFGMAAELAENNTLMVVGGGTRGRDPLIFRSGSIPYRGFLEGRVEGEKYILLLHLSNMELKLPSTQPADVETEVKSRQSEKKPPAKEKSKPAAEEKTNTNEPSVAGSVKKAAKKRSAKNNKKEAKNNEESQSESSSKKTRSKDGKNTTTGKDTKNKVEESATSPKGQATPKKDNKNKTDGGDASGSVRDSAGYVSSDDLGVWLKSIRMGKYLPLFIENEIDVDVLPELSDADLKELDIPVGSRRRLLKAVEQAADLRAEVMMSVKKMAKTTNS